MFKNIRITEHIRAQFRAEIFNIFNFVNYGNSSQGLRGNNVQGSNLGQIGGTYDVGFGAPGIGPGAPRNVQLALKVHWSMAERVGFEPTLEFPLNTLSKRAPSATRPSLRRNLGKDDSVPEGYRIEPCRPRSRQLSFIHSMVSERSSANRSREGQGATETNDFAEE